MNQCFQYLGRLCQHGKKRDGIPMVDYSSQRVIDIDFYGMVKSKTKTKKRQTYDNN